MKLHMQQLTKYLKRRNKGVSNPHIGKLKKGDLSTIYGFDLFYHKINYEISYQIYSEKELIVIILIGTRENFYQELKKYISNN